MHPELAPPIAATPIGVTRLVVLFDYRGPGRELVLGLKHNRTVGEIPALADRMVGAIRAASWAPAPAVVTWIPTTAARRSQRGYDQSLLLAKAVARRLRLPCRRLLQRRGNAQEGLDGAARRVGPELTPLRQVGAAVLVIDDVVTTGATLAAAAASLRTAGAPDVYAAALAVSRARPGDSHVPCVHHEK